MQVMCIVAAFALRGSVFGENSFLLQEVIGHKRLVSGTPSSGTPRESQAKFRDGIMWVLVQIRDLVRVVGIVVPFAPRGISIRRKFVLSSNPGYTTEGGGVLRGQCSGKIRFIEKPRIRTMFRDRTVWVL